MKMFTGLVSISMVVACYSMTFNEFVKKYNKVYYNTEERDYREYIYYSNKHYVENASFTASYGTSVSEHIPLSIAY